MRPMAEPIDDTALVERFPWAQLDHDSKHHFRGWLERKLLIRRCDDCGHWHHPPKPVCPKCWSSALTDTEVSGRGTVFMAMRLHQGPPAEGVDYTKGPHPVAVVDLEEPEGVRFTSTIVDCPHEEIVPGLAVELDWIERSGTPFPVFRKREGA